MWIAVIYILASLVALCGLYLLYRLFASTGDKRPWLLIGGALLIFSILSGGLAFRVFSSKESLAIDFLAGPAALVFSALTLAGIYFLGQRYQSLIQSIDQTHQKTRLLRLILDHLPNPVVLKDDQMVYQAANTSFEDFLGKEEAEILGRKDSDFFPRPQSNAFSLADELAIQNGVPQVQEQEVIGASGKRWMQFTRIPILNDGATSSILVTSQDITERKQLERELEENKLLLQAVVDEKQEMLGENQKAIDKQDCLLRFEHLLASLAARFIDPDPEKIDQNLHYALRSISAQTGFDRCRVLLFDADGSELNPAYEWTALQERTLSAAPDEESLPSLHAGNPPWTSFGGMQVIHVSAISQLSPEAPEVIDYMQTQGILSFTAVPLISGRSVIGYLWLDSLSAEVQLESDILDLLKTAGTIFVHALERNRTAEETAGSQVDMQQRLAALEKQGRENTLLNELGDLLQVCRTVDEAYPIIARYTQQLIPSGSGALYLVGASDDSVERAAAWGPEPPPETEMAVNECWALRRGRLHLVRNFVTGLNCTHVKPPVPAAYLCTPLIAHGDTIGLLHLRPAEKEAPNRSVLEDYQRLSEMIAEHIALALSNLSLRDRLRSQAIRDPLTGLFNRRYMEETLEREIRRAVRHTSPVSVVMFDMDNLKRVNDAFGHDAGDVVLKTLGSLMMKTFRGEDVPCRYGGDEFTIVLPEATVSEAFRRAEQFREAFKRLEYDHEGKHIGPLTLSLGIAAYPDHGATAERLLQIADNASYSAKLQGRDRVMIGGDAEE
jgi:diguanylate cyclase (GGDEF)-like protein/PAS domain S-box-containing protein